MKFLKDFIAQKVLFQKRRQPRSLGRSFLRSKYILVKESIDGTLETFFLWYFPFKGTVLSISQLRPQTCVFFNFRVFMHSIVLFLRMHSTFFSAFINPVILKL